jgi:GWxTD domain-containing protein
MKRFFCIAGICLFACASYSQTLSTNVATRSCVFHHPQDGDYVEVYMSIAANALHYSEKSSGLFQGAVEVQLVVSEGATVTSFDKYTLLTPEVQDTSVILFSIIDQRRLKMPTSAASLELQITDVHKPDNMFSFAEPLLPLGATGIEISDIQFIENFHKTDTINAFTKNGYEFQPYPMHFFPSKTEKMVFYGEVYRTDKMFHEEQFLITFSIHPSSGEQKENAYFQYTKYQPAEVVSFLKQFDISNLQAGNYDLVVEVRNKKNELIATKKTFIQRANHGPANAYENIAQVNAAGTFVDGYTEEQLNYFLDVIRPRASSDETKLIESLSERVEPEMKKKFLYNFWVQRNPADPHNAFLAYLAEVKKANESFGTPSKAGYKTDRGRVYLQYGPPYDRIISTSEPGAYPYEIWFYDRLPDKQTKIGFAFYEPSLVTNDYKLLHSNARGELQDARWKVRIYENVASPQELHDFDNTEVNDDVYGSHRGVDVYNF